MTRPASRCSGASDTRRCLLRALCVERPASRCSGVSDARRCHLRALFIMSCHSWASWSAVGGSGAHVESSISRLTKKLYSQPAQVHVAIIDTHVAKFRNFWLCMPPPSLCPPFWYVSIHVNRQWSVSHNQSASVLKTPNLFYNTYMGYIFMILGVTFTVISPI